MTSIPALIERSAIDRAISSRRSVSASAISSIAISYHKAEPISGLACLDNRYRLWQSITDTGYGAPHREMD